MDLSDVSSNLIIYYYKIIYIYIEYINVLKK